MNDHKRTVLAVGVVAFILAAMFFVPWRLESSDEIRWAPVYRQPVSYSQSYATNPPGARYTSEAAKINVTYFLLELLAIGAVSGIAYKLASGSTEDESAGPS